MAKLSAAAAAALLTVAGGAADAAAAGAKPLGGPRALAVSVPADPVQIGAGTRAKTLVRVVNPNHAPVVVTIASRQLSLGDNGKVSVGSGPDPVWQRRARFPSRELTIPAQGYLDIPLTIRVPRRLPPDLYFIGFLVSPVATQAGALNVINQIGSFVTIDIPGPRVRKLAGHFDLPSFVLGSHVTGTLRIGNIGRAAVRFWGENDITSSPGNTFQQQRLNPSLLPAGRSRLVTVSGKPAWPVGIVTITTHVTYPGRTEAQTKELNYSKRVIVVAPWVVPAVLGAIVLLVSALWWTRRRSTRRKRGAAEPHPAGSGSV
jgi:hypothetical protein